MTTSKPGPVYTGLLFAHLKKIPTTIVCALAAVAGVGQAVVVHDLSGHRRLEAIMPSHVGAHDDDDPGQAPIPDLRELRSVTQVSGSPGSFRQAEWPLPISGPYPSNLRSWAPARSLALLSASSA